jgi:hypothetical protein
MLELAKHVHAKFQHSSFDPNGPKKFLDYFSYEKHTNTQQSYTIFTTVLRIVPNLAHAVTLTLNLKLRFFLIFYKN